MEVAVEHAIHDACDLLASGNYDDAYAAFSRLADAGNGWANLNLGWMNQQGLGRDVDLTQAEEHYLRAQGLAVPHAPYYLGSLYRQLKRYPEALENFERAAAAGNPSGAYWAYSMLHRGDEVARDSDKAGHYLQRAAELGHVFAKRDLAKRMIRGELGFRKITSGLWTLLTSGISMGRIAASDMEDMRIR